MRDSPLVFECPEMISERRACVECHWRLVRQCWWGGHSCPPKSTGSKLPVAQGRSIMKSAPPYMHKRLPLVEHRRAGHLGHYNQVISPKITFLHHLSLQPDQR